MRIVLDTNVLVAALLSPYGPPAQILRLCLVEEVTVLHDPRILAEYREVLRRARFGFDPRDIVAVLRQLEAGGESVVALLLAEELPDPDDLPFLEVAVTGRADALVTGNERHFSPAARRQGVRVVGPAEAVRILARQGGLSSS